MRIRQHVNPLKSDLLDIADVPRVEAPAGRALEVELGAAEAHFLIDRARDDAATVFVGVEIRRELVEAVNAAVRGGGPGQRAQRVREHVGRHGPRLFADGSVRRFFLNFPDPWFKSRQHKRRVIGPGLMAEIGRALAPGGELYVQTDIFALALDAMAALEALQPATLRQRRGRVDVPAREPLRREVAARAPVRERGRPGLAAALPPARTLCLTLSPLRGRADRNLAPPSERRISSSSLIRSRSAAAFSNSSASERSNISRRIAEMICGSSSSGMSLCLAFMAGLVTSTKSSWALPSSAWIAFSIVLGVMPCSRLYSSCVGAALRASR